MRANKEEFVLSITLSPRSGEMRVGGKEGEGNLAAGLVQGIQQLVDGAELLLFVVVVISHLIADGRILLQRGESLEDRNRHLLLKGLELLLELLVPGGLVVADLRTLPAAGAAAAALGLGGRGRDRGGRLGMAGRGRDTTSRGRGRGDDDRPGRLGHLLEVGGLDLLLQALLLLRLLALHPLAMPVAVLPIVVFERLLAGLLLVLVGQLLGDKSLGTAELEDVDETVE